MMTHEERLQRLSNELHQQLEGLQAQQKERYKRRDMWLKEHNLDEADAIYNTIMLENYHIGGYHHALAIIEKYLDMPESQSTEFNS